MNVFIDYELAPSDIEHMLKTLQDEDMKGWLLCCYAPIGKLTFIANGYNYGNYHSPLENDYRVPLVEFAIIFDEILSVITIEKKLEIIHFEGPSSITFTRLEEDKILIKGLSSDIPSTIVSFRELCAAANIFFRKLHLELNNTFPAYLAKLDANPQESNLYPNWEALCQQK